jgi:hypothetical protein
VHGGEDRQRHDWTIWNSSITLPPISGGDSR